MVVGWIVKEAKNTLREGRTKNKKSSSWIGGRKGEKQRKRKNKTKKNIFFSYIH